MKHQWLYLTQTDVETEYRQCEGEGRDTAPAEKDFLRVRSLNLEMLENQMFAEALLDKTITLPMKDGFRYDEPSDLDSIRMARPPTPLEIADVSLTAAQLEDKIHGAWSGRCVGCLLGKPVEGWRRVRMWGLLKDLERWPLTDYFRIEGVDAEIRKKYSVTSGGRSRWFADLITETPEDDDLNFTVAGLAILKRCGATFKPEDVASFWMHDIPMLRVIASERIAYRNFSINIAPPASAIYRNPYREWIGAQTRADFWGYATGGDPETAAEFAWRDASISHVKNGIYGAMWVAAMTAAAFLTSDIPTIIRAGLDQIPAECRLAQGVKNVVGWRAKGTEYDAAVERLHDIWDENYHHDWTHVISNAMIVTIALLWGEGDFAKSICRAVQPCFDTASNGATVGSILGVIHGRKALPDHWTAPTRDILNTGVAGFARVRLADLSRETLRLVRQV